MTLLYRWSEYKGKKARSIKLGIFNLKVLFDRCLVPLLFCFQSSWTQILKSLLETKIKRPLLWHCSDWLLVLLSQIRLLFLYFGLGVCLCFCYQVFVFRLCWSCCVLIYGCADVGVCSLGVAWLCFVVNGSLRASKRALRPQGRIKTSQLLGKKFLFYEVFLVKYFCLKYGNMLRLGVAGVMVSNMQKRLMWGSVKRHLLSCQCWLWRGWWWRWLLW